MPRRPILIAVAGVMLAVIAVVLWRSLDPNAPEWSKLYVELTWASSAGGDSIYDQEFGWDDSGTFYANLITENYQSQIEIVDRKHKRMCTIGVYGWFTSGWGTDKTSGHAIYGIYHWNQYGESDSRTLDVVTWQLTWTVTGVCPMNSMLGCQKLDPPEVSVHECLD